MNYTDIDRLPDDSFRFISPCDGTAVFVLGCIVRDDDDVQCNLSLCSCDLMTGAIIDAHTSQYDSYASAKQMLKRLLRLFLPGCVRVCLTNSSIFGQYLQYLKLSSPSLESVVSRIISSSTRGLGRRKKQVDSNDNVVLNKLYPMLLQQISCAPMSDNVDDDDDDVSDGEDETSKHDDDTKTNERKTTWDDRFEYGIRWWLTSADLASVGAPELDRDDVRW